MNYYELMQLGILCGQEIDTSWNFFISIHMAIFGAILISNNLRRISMLQKFILYSSYLLFTVVNVRSKINSYKLYCAIFYDLNKADSKIGEGVKNYIVNVDFDDRITICVIIHVFALLIFSFLLFYKGNNINAPS